MKQKQRTTAAQLQISTRMSRGASCKQRKVCYSSLAAAHPEHTLPPCLPRSVRSENAAILAGLTQPPGAAPAPGRATGLQDGYACRAIGPAGCPPSRTWRGTTKTRRATKLANGGILPRRSEYKNECAGVASTGNRVLPREMNTAMGIRLETESRGPAQAGCRSHFVIGSMRHDGPCLFTRLIDGIRWN